MQSAASEVFDDAPSTWHDNRHVVTHGSAAYRRFVLTLSEQTSSSLHNSNVDDCVATAACHEHDSNVDDRWIVYLENSVVGLCVGLVRRDD